MGRNVSSKFHHEIIITATITLQ